MIKLTEREVGLLQPGHELDMLIAEHVMGYVWIQYYEPRGTQVFRALESPENVERYNVPLATGNEPLSPDIVSGKGDIWMRSFSTCPGDAWLVVEKLASQHGLAKITFYVARDGREKYEVVLNGYDASEKTMPLAVCRLALKMLLTNKD